MGDRSRYFHMPVSLSRTAEQQIIMVNRGFCLSGSDSVPTAHIDTTPVPSVFRLYILVFGTIYSIWIHNILLQLLIWGQ